MVAKAQKMTRRYKHPLRKDLTVAPAEGDWEDLVVRSPKVEEASAVVEARPEPPKPTLRQIAEEKEKQVSGGDELFTAVFALCDIAYRGVCSVREISGENSH